MDGKFLFLQNIRTKPWFPNAMGGIIYGTGDTLAALIANQFQPERLLGVVAIGALVYGFEIPRYFRWIEKKVANLGGVRSAIAKTSLALLYFNPLWITRHLFFVNLVGGHLDAVSWALFRTGLVSFTVNIPVSVIANYIIQQKIGLDRRFFASAIFSGVMAIYYSMSSVWFG